MQSHKGVRKVVCHVERTEKHPKKPQKTAKVAVSDFALFGLDPRIWIEPHRMPKISALRKHTGANGNMFSPHLSV
jgi:hypothetical protein